MESTWWVKLMSINVFKIKVSYGKKAHIEMLPMSKVYGHLRQNLTNWLSISLYTHSTSWVVHLGLCDENGLSVPFCRCSLSYYSSYEMAYRFVICSFFFSSFNLSNKSIFDSQTFLYNMIYIFFTWHNAVGIRWGLKEKNYVFCNSTVI